MEACKGDRTAVRTCGSSWPPTGPCADSTSYSNMQCSPAYHGNLCGLCAQGHGTTEPFTCAKCLPKATIAGLYALAAVGTLLLMKVLCITAVPPAEQSDLTNSLGERRYGSRREECPPTAARRPAGPNQPVDPLLPSELLKPLVLFSQYLLIVSSLSIEWPPTLLYPFKALAWAWASSSPETLNIECLLSKDAALPIAAQKVLFYLVLPIAMLLVLLLLDSLAMVLVSVVQGRFSRKERGAIAISLRNKIVPTILVVLFFFFPSICRTTFSMFACTEIDHDVEPPYEATAVGKFWVLDINQHCMRGYHRVLALGLGIPLLIVFCVLLPIGIMLLTVLNKHRLAEPHYKQHYGFLYRSYRRGCCWWETVVTLQTLVLVAISVFSYSLGPYYTTLCMNSALALTGLILSYMKPYAHHVLGLVFMQCTGCLLLTSYFALTLLQVDDHAPGQAYGMVVGTCVLMVNVIFVISVLWKVLRLSDWSVVIGTVKSVSQKAAGLVNRFTNSKKDAGRA